MSQYLDEIRAANDPNAIVIPFRLDQTPYEQIKNAVANLPPQSCHRHPHERLTINLAAMVAGVLPHDDGPAEYAWKSDFTAVYERCSKCPRTAAVQEQDIDGCAAFFHPIMMKSLCHRDQQGKLVPHRGKSQALEAYRSVQDQYEDWLAKEPDFHCQLGNEVLHRHATSVKPPFKKLILWPQRNGCPQCRLERRGILPDDAFASFDNFVIDPPALRAHVAACRAFAAKPQGVLLLLGGCGTGKTHLAIAIMRELIRRGQISQQYVKHRQFVAQHRLAQRPVAFGQQAPTSPLADSQETGLLVYDELTETVDGGSPCEDLLLDLFETRIGKFKPSIITANIARGKLEAVLGSRLHDRLKRAAFNVLEFGLASKRASLKATYQNRHLRGEKL